MIKKHFFYFLILVISSILSISIAPKNALAHCAEPWGHHCPYLCDRGDPVNIKVSAKYRDSSGTLHVMTGVAINLVSDHAAASLGTGTYSTIGKSANNETGYSGTAKDWSAYCGRWSDVPVNMMQGGCQLDPFHFDISLSGIADVNSNGSWETAKLTGGSIPAEGFNFTPGIPSKPSFNIENGVTWTLTLIWKNPQVVINGSCGTANGGTYSTAPSSNLCSAGTASSVTGSGPWSWTCNGSNGGTNASCSAAKITNSCPDLKVNGNDSATVKQGDPVKLSWSGGSNVKSFDIKQQPDGSAASTILYANAQNITSGSIDVMPSLTTTYFLDVLYDGASSNVSCPAYGVIVNVRPSQSGSDRPVPPN